MSAFGGILNLDCKPIDRQMLETMSNALTCNGPDAAGQYVNGAIGMVYRAFWTNKESRQEQQPLVTDQGHVLTWDGRLDNRSELIRLLEDQRFGDASDADLVMASFRKWGIKCLSKLIGDFALSLWERRSRTLFLARDHAGPRPLYYHRSGDEFVWASELRVLLALRGSQLEVNDEFVAGYLSHQITNALTPYQHVYAVLPGHVATVHEGAVRVERFWGPDPNYEIRYQTDAEYEEHFRQLFRESVRCRMRVDGPVWTALSGGLDSSAITCMAHEILKSGDCEASDVKTVSFVYDLSSSSDERDFIASVEEKIGATGFHVRESEYPPLSVFPDRSRISFPDGLDCHFARHKALFEEMNKVRGRVLLTGHGGDEMLHSGASPTLELRDRIAQYQPLQLHRTLREWCAFSRKPYVGLLWQEGIVPSLPLKLQVLLDHRAHMRVPRWLNEGFVKRLSLRERKFDVENVFGFKLPSSRSQSLAYLSVVKLAARAAYRSRGSIEVSHPYMHRPLVEFIHAIPLKQKMRPGETRSLMRRALKNLLPPKVLHRKTKRGPDEAALRALGREWPQLERMLTNSRAEMHGYVDGKTLLNAFETARHGKGDTNLFVIISLELWLRSLEGWGIAARNTARFGEQSPQSVAVQLMTEIAGS
jgi:asparagine synthase (glutamine-hydrolysing)